MEAKKYIYAAVGAPVAVAKNTQSRVDEIRAKIEENLKSLSTDAQKRIDTWATEGERAVGRITDAKSIDELTTRVDFDQVQTQVNKLRDQLEDLVATWRSNFRPATEAPAKVEEKPVAKATAAAKPAAKKPAAKKPAAKKAPAAKATAAKKPAAKQPAAKQPAAKQPAATKAS
jgi:hypothetical protein